MSQHDQVIANADGATVRADINSALAAIFSNSSDATAPTTTVAYQWWADTGSTPPMLRQRNAANSAWIDICELSSWSLKSVAAQTGKAYTTGGTSTAYTLTTNAILTALTTGEEWDVTFNAAAGATPTLARDGLTAKSLKYRDSTGAKQAVSSTQIPLNWRSKVVYDGTDYIVREVPPSAAASSGGVLGAFRNLQASATGTGANVTVTADEFVVENSSNAYQTLRSVSLTINTAGSGANGLDTGTLAGSTGYAVWVIAKADGTTAGLISTSATAPTMPADYTYKARVGWIRTDGTANKYPLGFTQRGRRVQYLIASGSNLTSPPQMASGTAGNAGAGTYASIAVANFVPPTASCIRLHVYCPGGGNALGVAPNNGYGAYNSTNQPPLNFFSNANSAAIAGELMLEGANIYWYSQSASGYLNCLGWEDNL